MACPVAAKAELFESIRVFRNHERRNSYVDGQSSGSYESTCYDRAQAAAA